LVLPLCLPERRIPGVGALPAMPEIARKIPLAAVRLIGPCGCTMTGLLDVSLIA